MRSYQYSVSMLQHSRFIDYFTIYLYTVFLNIFFIRIKISLSRFLIIIKLTMTFGYTHTVDLHLRLPISSPFTNKVDTILKRIFEHSRHLRILIDVPNLRSVLQLLLFLLSSQIFFLLFRK